MFHPDQLKDLALFNSFKAMQCELAAAGAAQQAQQLAQMLEKAQQEIERLTANPAAPPATEAVMEADSKAISRLRVVEGFLAACTPMDIDIGEWSIDNLLNGDITLLPNPAAIPVAHPIENAIR